MGMREWFGWATGRGHETMQRALSFEDIYGYAYSDSEFATDGDKALRLIPFYAAVSLIADQMSMLPTGFVEKRGRSRIPVDGPAWMEDPDPNVSLFDWWHQYFASLLVRGNAIGTVLQSGPKIVGVRWLHPGRVQPLPGHAIPHYLVAGDSTPRTLYKHGGDLIHARAFIMPGSTWGLSPVEQFRRQLSMAGKIVEWGEDYYDNGVIPTGIIKNSQATLDGDKTREAKEQFMASVKHGEPVAFDKNWSWETVQLSAQDAQFLTALKDVATHLGTILRVDPEDVGGTAGGSLRYSTVEGNQRKLNVRTLGPWATRTEQAFQPLLGNVRMKLNLDALARPNLLELNRSIGEELRNGTLTNDEARALRDRPPLTPEQRAQWQADYGKRGPSPLDVADLIQPQKEGD